MKRPKSVPSLWQKLVKRKSTKTRRKPKNSRKTMAPSRSKKAPTFVKGAAQAVSREALGNSGHVGNYIHKKIFEDGMGGLGGTPVNNASSGSVAGLGTSRDGSQGEPGVNKKRCKTPLLSYKQFKRNVK